MEISLFYLPAPCQYSVGFICWLIQPVIAVLVVVHNSHEIREGMAETGDSRQRDRETKQREGLISGPPASETIAWH